MLVQSVITLRQILVRCWSLESPLAHLLLFLHLADNLLKRCPLHDRDDPTDTVALWPAIHTLLSCQHHLIHCWVIETLTLSTPQPCIGVLLSQQTVSWLPMRKDSLDMLPFSTTGGGDQYWCGDYLYSNYLIGLVFRSLREMFSNARKIQVNKPQSMYYICITNTSTYLCQALWLWWCHCCAQHLQDRFANSARMIAKTGHPVEWITPLGMPVVQPYHKEVAKDVSLSVSSIYILCLLFFTLVVAHSTPVCSEKE